MTEFSNKTLAQIVTANPRAAAIFEKHHLDFCCKGKRTLQLACEAQHVPVEELIDELAGLGAAQEGSSQEAFSFDGISLWQLCSYIANTHHAYVKKTAPQIDNYLRKTVASHGHRHPELLKITELFASIKEELEMHMEKEELVLFPRIKELEKFEKEEPGPFRIEVAYLYSPISIMEQEHDHTATLMEEIRSLSDDFSVPEEACTTYRLAYASLRAFESDLHQHVHLENNILFPKAMALFRSLKRATFNC